MLGPLLVELFGEGLGGVVLLEEPALPACLLLLPGYGHGF